MYRAIRPGLARARVPTRAAILTGVEWFFTALLVIIALATAGVAGFAAYRIYVRQH